jgi:PAS domain S-box-containing protein
MPHGLGYFWDSGLLRLNVISDSLIGASYYTVAIVLFQFVRKRRDVPFGWMLVLFAAITVGSGTTRLMAVWNTWHADYWTDGTIKAITSLAWASVAILSIVLLPRALEVPDVGDWLRVKARLEDEVRERREAELDLRIREAAYREQAELLDLTHDAIFVRSLGAKITYWNRAAERLYGWGAEEARGRASHELLATRFPVPRQEIEEEVLKNGVWEGELVHRRRDGSEIIVSSRWALRRDASGNSQGFLESNRDITAHLREERKFRDLLEAAPDAMVIVNTNGLIQLVNAQAEKLFGYSRAELIGHPIETLMPRRYHTPHLKHREWYSRSPRARAMGTGLELYGLRKDGSEFPVEVSLSPLDTGDGMLVSSAIRDVTERRRTDENIQRLNSELSRKVAEVMTANSELETFSYSVSHDLRAPLRHIDGFARILQEEHIGELSDDGQRYLQRILNAVTHMGRLVDDLLALARIGRKELSRQRVKLDEVVREALAELPAEEQKREIEWRIETLPEVEGDPGLLKLVFVNLLSNAAKFTRSRQTSIIEVGNCGAGNAPIFFVRDNGVGFDPKYADKLFGVFQRLHRQEEFEGTGIGLATVQRIIQRHGGEIRAEAALDRGATFYFTLQASQRAKASTGATEISIGRVHEQ